MKYEHTILFMHTWGSLTLNQLHHNVHIHDFRLNHRIRVLHDFQKINHLRVKINEIKCYHHVPRPKPSKIDPSLDQFGSVSRIFKIKWEWCSWRHFLFINFKYQFSNIIKRSCYNNKLRAQLGWQVFWLVNTRAWVQHL